MTYEDLAVWMIAENVDDSWLIAINDKPAGGKFSLCKIRELVESCENTDFKVLHVSQSSDEGAEWITFECAVSPALGEMIALRNDVQKIYGELREIRDKLVTIVFVVFWIPFVLALIAVILWLIKAASE